MFALIYFDMGIWYYISEQNINKFSLFYTGAVVAQWIRQRTLNREVPGSNLLAAAVDPWARHFILIA